MKIESSNPIIREEVKSIEMKAFEKGKLRELENSFIKKSEDLHEEWSELFNSLKKMDKDDPNINETTNKLSLLKKQIDNISNITN